MGCSKSQITTSKSINRATTPSKNSKNMASTEDNNYSEILPKRFRPLG